MKRTLAIVLTLALILTFTSACAKGAAYRDGVYAAQAPEFASSGWKEIMEITIEGGKLVKIDWDAVYKDESIPIRKKQYSKSGLYGMMAAGSISEWYDQAIVTEQFVLEKGLDALSVNDEGYTDVVTGCTINIAEFDELLRACLKQASAT